jgi:hypothetical protein
MIICTLHNTVCSHSYGYLPLREVRFRGVSSNCHKMEVFKIGLHNHQHLELTDSSEQRRHARTRIT